MLFRSYRNSGQDYDAYPDKNTHTNSNQNANAGKDTSNVEVEKDYYKYGKKFLFTANCSSFQKVAYL